MVQAVIAWPRRVAESAGSADCAESRLYSHPSAIHNPAVSSAPILMNVSGINDTPDLHLQEVPLMEIEGFQHILLVLVVWLVIGWC